MRPVIIFLLLLPMWWACAESFPDKEIEINEKVPDKALSLLISVAMPNQPATRGMNGESSGLTNEMLLKSATIYFCVDDEVKMKLFTEDCNTEEGGKVSIRAVVDDETSLYELAGKKVSVWLVGNAQELTMQHNLSDNIAEGGCLSPSEAVFRINDIEALPIGATGESGHLLPLVNASEFILDLEDIEANDAEIGTLFQRNGNNESVWQLNESAAPLQLERGVARIDFKDIDRSGFPDNVTPDSHSVGLSLPYSYIIGNTSVIVRLHHMQPFNVSPESYLFRHTSEGSFTEAKSPADLLGAEGREQASGSYRWVATPDWELTGGAFTKRSNFLNPLTIDGRNYRIEGEKGKIDIEELIKIAPADDGYYPWCYVTENTLPSVSLMIDRDDEGNPVVSNYATGVAFTFEVLDTNGNPLRFSANREGYPSEITNSEGGSETICIHENEKSSMEIEPEDGGYYLTYIAYIVHEDSEENSQGDIPPMHYGVVRNNIYQMSISRINALPNATDQNVDVETPREPSEWLMLGITGDEKGWPSDMDECDFIYEFYEVENGIWETKAFENSVWDHSFVWLIYNKETKQYFGRNTNAYIQNGEKYQLKQITDTYRLFSQTIVQYYDFSGKVVLTYENGNYVLLFDPQ